MGRNDCLDGVHTRFDILEAPFECLFVGKGYYCLLVTHHLKGRPWNEFFIKFCGCPHKFLKRMARG